MTADLTFTGWTEFRLIGPEAAVDRFTRLLQQHAEFRVDTGTRPPREGGDGKSRRQLVARLAQEPQAAVEVIDLDTLTRVVRDEVERHGQHSRSRTAAELRARATRLRHAPPADDPLVSALTAGCHTQYRLIYADPAVVAAVALEAIADHLDAGTPHEEKETADA